MYNHAADPVRAKAVALRAISLDSSVAEGYIALAYVLANYEYRWRRPNRGIMASQAGRPDEAIAHFQPALVLEPVSLRDDPRHVRLLAKTNLR